MYLRYNEKAPFVLQGITINIKPNEKVRWYSLKYIQGPFYKYQDWLQKSKFIAGIITIT